MLAIYDPKILYNSLIRFYDITFNDLVSEPIYDVANSKILSVNRLGLDSFIVNSIALVND